MAEPEELARQEIDPLLEKCGWQVQDKSAVNLHSQRGVAVCELSFKTGEPDYTLFVDGKAIGTVEAKPAGHSLTGVEEQSEKYVNGVPFGLPAWRSPLPFCYESTGTETRFTNRLDPEPRSRDVFAFHRPETLLKWAQAEKQLTQRLREFPPLRHRQALAGADRSDHQPGSLLRRQPSARAHPDGHRLGQDLHRGQLHLPPRSSTPAPARVLFLVDRGNLGEQTLKEFQQFVSPVNNFKFTEEFIVQHLTAQRPRRLRPGRHRHDPAPLLHAQGRGRAGAGPGRPRHRGRRVALQEPLPVEYNPTLPIESFDFIVTDECHRSIYNLWRQVLEYFDASLIGLTATPSKQTFGFFKQNLVMEYNHEKAVADGVNVGYDVYRIQTPRSRAGVEGRRRLLRGQARPPDAQDPLGAARRGPRLRRRTSSTATSSPRTRSAPCLQTFRDKLFTEIFPGRTDVPKTLIFAKDDSHADDIVRICREVFGKGNDFCKKITYKTTGESAQGSDPEFRNSYNPRIAVTVDMIATGTDIKPLEIVFFMRSVKSRNFFEQMKGRGVRVISETEMEQVNPDIKRKTRFVIVDAVGVCERDKTDSRPLEKKRTVTFDKLLDAVALGNREPDALECLAGRLIRLESASMKLWQPKSRAPPKARPSARSPKLCSPRPIPTVSKPRPKRAKEPYFQPTEKDLQSAQAKLMQEAVAPLATNPDLRQLLIKIQQASEQIIDVISRDRVLFAGAAQQTTENAEQVTKSFRDYIEQAQGRDHRAADPLQPPLQTAAHRTDAQGTGEETPRTTRRLDRRPPLGRLRRRRAEESQRPLPGRPLRRPRRAGPLRPGTRAGA